MPVVYLTPGEVATKLGISRPMVIRYMDQGRIKFTLIAGRRVIRQQDAKKPAPKKIGAPRKSPN